MTISIPRMVSGMESKRIGCPGVDVNECINVDATAVASRKVNRVNLQVASSISNRRVVKYADGSASRDSQVLSVLGVDNVRSERIRIRVSSCAASGNKGDAVKFKLSLPF
ncbi:hypothetical protein EON65_50585 [archaeon]|nr:MAG: hypothetical protein EON65_50585 [archaeon]